MSDAEILERLKAIFEDTFEVDTQSITMDTHLFQDLDLDSIDAVDLAIKLQTMTGKRIKPEDFKSVRTVGDVVANVRTLLAA
ncbi:acyl carrier protein [Methylobacillus gramineus]|uniref:acyl carrier protein n=1 Tax=Methylobacillus gramineus TaxID=755169 RepID=UPI001CFFDAF9|nr:acyl carrier protein [Methylobacillus gramineus]MCB5183736.1 acyl carrier protein [Methylobacillus gramineus]